MTSSRSIHLSQELLDDKHGSSVAHGHSKRKRNTPLIVSIWLVAFLLIAIAIFFLMQNSAENLIIGKWKLILRQGETVASPDSEPIIVSFESDGRCTHPDYSQGGATTYHIEKGGKQPELVIQNSATGAVHRFAIHSIKSQELVLKTQRPRSRFDEKTNTVDETPEIHSEVYKRVQ